MRAVLLLFCLSLVVISVSSTNIITKDGRKCLCRTKTCDDDVSCEEHNCICLIKALKALEAKKKLKYPNQKWVLIYRRHVERRCRCTKKCEKRCNDVEVQICVKKAFDRFTCAWTEALGQIVTEGTKEAVGEFLSDIRSVNLKCIVDGCKPQCQGNTDCNPLTEAVGEKECIGKAFESVAAGLPDEAIKDVIEDGKRGVLSLVRARQKCSAESKTPGALKTCLDRLEREPKIELSLFLDSLSELAGECSSKTILNLIKEGLTHCALIGCK